MTITQLITRLTELKKEHGGRIRVETWYDSDFEDTVGIHSVELSTPEDGIKRRVILLTQDY